jgi:hypothetical protein
MRIRSRQKLWGLTAALTTLAVLPSCAAGAGTSGKTSTSRTPTTTAATAVTTTAAIAAPPTPQAPLTTQAPRTEKWIDLKVGDCLADPPPTDPTALTVTVVDCATAHAAEVYFRAAVGVNQAIANVANQQCDLGFSLYTGQLINGSPFAVTYLIDSNQDRTWANPEASTVICLLQAANSRPLTGSARR